MLAEEGVERIAGPHCYAFYAGSSVFDALADAEPGTFYLTDFLLRHFDTLVIEGLGLDRHPELLPHYFGNYRRLVYLAQTEDAERSAAARARGRPARPRLRVSLHRAMAARPQLRRARPPDGDARMAELVVVSWRDIPAQVIVKAGRETAKRQLSERFQQAIDRAAMRAGLTGNSTPISSEWRRGEPRRAATTCKAEAIAESPGRSAYIDADLERLIRAKGSRRRAGRATAAERRRTT